MFQRFHENTQVSRVIKNLLSSEAIPLLQTVVNGMPLIEGCRYLRDDEPVICTKSGVYGSEAVVESVSFNKPEYIKQPSNIAFSNFVSSVGWYDDLTHKQLGEYLRYLRDTRSVDLMRYYNCYNATELTDVYLNTAEIGPLVCSDDKTGETDSAGNPIYKVAPKDPPIYCGVTQKYAATTTYRFGSLPGYKVIAVPIKFDTTYTIAVEANNVVSLRGLIYNRNGMVEQYSTDTDSVLDKVYYSDHLSYSCTTLPYSKFSAPFTYRIDLATLSDELLPLKLKQSLYMRQKDLQLVLQVPANSTSSIVVLEGDYTHTVPEITQGSSVYDLDPDTGKIVPRELNPLYNTDAVLDDSRTVVDHVDTLSLLYYNTGVSYAFSNRLVEYLLLNVVTPLETLSTNIARVQQSLKQLYPSYSKKLLEKQARLGVWDDSIPYYIKSYIFRNRDRMEYPLDHDGYINKDVESLLATNGVYIT